MRRPALLAALCSLCGLLVGRYLPLPLFVLIIGTFLSGSLAVWLRRRAPSMSWATTLCACLSLLSASAFWYGVRTGVASRHHLSRSCDLPGPITLDGTVAADPDRRERFTLVTVEAERAVIGGRPVRLTGRVLVRLGAPAAACAYGDRVRVTGRLRSPAPARNPGGFDARAFYGQQGIAGLMSVRDPALLIILAAGRTPTFHTVLIRPMKHAIQQTIDATLRGPSNALIKGMLLGEKQQLPEDLLTAFSDTGLTHILAVSGFNVGLIALIMMTLFLLLRLPRGLATAATLIVIVLYAFITNLTPSVVRASIMAGLFLMGTMIDRQTDPLNILSVAALLILILWPQALFDLSFQLSFAATLSLIIGYPWLRDRLPAVLRRADTWWKRWLIEGLVVSSAAQIGTMPLIAFAFSKVSVIAPVANLFVGPLVLVATTLGSASVLAGLLSLELARLFSAANWLALQGMMHITALCASVPYASLTVPRPSLLVLAGYYAALVFVGSAGRSAAARRGLVALAFAGLTVLGWSLWLRPRELIVTFLDVGQGDAVVVECPNGRTLLVDGGVREPEFDTGERVILPFLRSTGSPRVDALILTHPHNDHLGGLPAILESAQVAEVIDGGMAPDTPAFRRWLDAIKTKRVRYRTTLAGDSLDGLGEVRGAVLHPSAAFTGHTGTPPYGLNNASVVLRLEYRTISVLLTGDIEEPAEEALVQKSAHLRSTVIKVPHHGSLTSSGPAWVQAVRPAAAVISVGAWNRFGHPSSLVIDRYRRSGAAVYRTDQDGGVVLRSDGRSFRIQPTMHHRQERPLLTPSQAWDSICLTVFLRESIFERFMKPAGAKLRPYIHMPTTPPPMTQHHLPILILTALVSILWSCSAHGQRTADPLAAAQAAEETGQYQQAIQQYQEAIRVRPGQVDAYIGLSRIYRTTGRYDEAEAQARKAVQVDPSSSGAHRALGDLLALRGQYREAEDAFQRALTSPAASPMARLNLGLLYEETGRRADARRMFEDLTRSYQAGRMREAEGIAATAVAAQHLGLFHDANDLFAEATQLAPRDVVAYVAWGYLFLTKYNRREAVEVFGDALKINPSDPAALVGLAESQAEDRASQAEAGCQKALAINPRLIEAHRLLARLYLIDEQYTAAVTHLNQALAVNPSSPATRALLAACYHAMGQDTVFQAECQRVLEVNSHYGELYAIIGENLARRYRFHEAVEMERRAIQLDPELWTAYANLGINLSRVGQEDEGRRYLDQAFEHDSFNTWTYNTLNLFDSFKDYTTRQSLHFILKLHKDEEPVYGTLALDVLEEAYRMVSPRYRFDLKDPVLVEIFPRHDDFAVRISGLPGAGALLGVCFGEVIVADSPRARQGGAFNWGQTLWHEFAHVLHLQLTRNRIPRWLAEGIAVYEARRGRPEWDLDMRPEFAVAVEREQLLKVSELNSGFTRPKTIDQVSLSYYQASIVIEYIVQKHGFDAILKMLSLYNEEKNTTEVLQAVLGLSLSALDDAFLAYAKQRTAAERAALRFSPKSSKGLSESDLREEIERHPGSFHAHLLLGQLLLGRGDEDGAIQHLRKARELVPHYVHGESPYRLLATLYRKRGDEAAAIRELEALTAIDEDNVEANKELAQLYAARKQDADVIRVLSRAVMINPFDPEVRNWLGAAYEGKQLFGLAIREYKAALAVETADFAGAHCNLARAYLLTGMKPEAKQEALRALEIAPTYEAAQRILLNTME